MGSKAPLESWSCQWSFRFRRTLTTFGIRMHDARPTIEHVRGAQNRPMLCLPRSAHVVVSPLGPYQAMPARLDGKISSTLVCNRYQQALLSAPLRSWSEVHPPIASLGALPVRRTGARAAGKRMHRGYGLVCQRDPVAVRRRARGWLRRAPPQGRAAGARGARPADL